MVSDGPAGSIPARASNFKSLLDLAFGDQRPRSCEEFASRCRSVPGIFPAFAEMETSNRSQSVAKLHASDSIAPFDYLVGDRDGILTDLMGTA